ncbi:MAG: hypothetical protein KC561_17000, partial [Myxococcales bacterium]|nr:hypothetical protein [Myxococcales bacterium]
MNRLFDAFSRANKTLALVGGAVRDELLGGERCETSERKDLDFATDALPDDIEAILRDEGLSTHDVGRRWGTIGTQLRTPLGDIQDVQITTFRGETYTPNSRHPEVTFGSTLAEDLGRRDFTVNAIAKLADGTLVDPHHGRTDLATRTLRPVGDAHRMLSDDPLRMLRAARFAASHGLKPTADLVDAMHRKAHSLLRISRERWLLELDKLLVAEHASMGLKLLLDTRILGLILPEVAAMVDFHLESE